MASIQWNGKAISARVSAAAAAGVDKTMSECVADARSGHPAYPPASEPGERYANRTGFDAASTDIRDHARDDGGRVHGSWGSDADYALFVEIGTSREASGFPTAEEREAAGAGNADAIPPPSDPPRMAARPTLRPAADANYPKLPQWIRRAFSGERL